MWYPVITLNDEVGLLSCSIDNGWESTENRCLWYGYKHVYLSLEHGELKESQEKCLVSGQNSLPHRESWSKLSTIHSILITHLLRTVTTIWVLWCEPNSIRFYLSTVHPHKTCCFRFNIYGISFPFLTASFFFFDPYVTVALFLTTMTDEVRSFSQDWVIWSDIIFRPVVCLTNRDPCKSLIWLVS